jgi:hypothetical protein
VKSAAWKMPCSCWRQFSSFVELRESVEETIKHNVMPFKTYVTSGNLCPPPRNHFFALNAGDIIILNTCTVANYIFLLPEQHESMPIRMARAPA